MLGHSSLPFARLQTPKTPIPSRQLPPSLAVSLCCSRVAALPAHFLAVSVPALQPALCLQSFLLLGHSSLPFARLQTPKTLRVSFHQAWPSAFAAPGLLLKPPAAASTKPGCQPLLLQGCCSFLAVSIPALQPALCLHSLLLLGHSSLPFARLQTPKTSASASTKPGRQPLLLQGCC